MGFAEDVQNWAEKVKTRRRAVFLGVVTEAARSIVEGSEITGAPGQPVDTGALRASWQTQFLSDDKALISTNLRYAPGIEDGIGPHGPIALRSAVGGFHSVKLTRAGLQRIVDSVTRDVVANG